VTELGGVGFGGFGLFEDFGLFLTDGFFAFGELLVEGCYALEAGRAFVGDGPLAEEDGAFLLHLFVGEGVGGGDSEAL